MSLYGLYSKNAENLAFIDLYLIMRNPFACQPPPTSNCHQNICQCFSHWPNFTHYNLSIRIYIRICFAKEQTVRDMKKTKLQTFR